MSPPSLFRRLVGPLPRRSHGSPRELIFPANVLSLVRIPLAAAFAVAVAAERQVLALVILLVAAATDVADGWCARRLGQETVTGRVVDPLADKIFFVTAAVALVATGRLTVLAVLLLATREIAQIFLAVTLALRGKLVRTGTESHSHVLGKLTTALQASTAAVALLWPPAEPPFIAGTAVCGAAAAVDYWRSALKA